MRRRLALLALVVSLPLVAFPLVSPPPDRTDTLSHELRPYEGPDDLDRVEGIPTYNYSDLSERGQALFDQARTDGDAVVDAGTGAPEFDYETANSVLVRYDGENYQLVVRYNNRGPALEAFLLRFGSLLAGIVLAAAGGYVRLNADT
jgi:hypothetical protein